MTVSGNRAAGFGEKVLIAVIVNIGEGDTVTFVQFAGSGGGGYIGEEFPLLIVQQHVRQHGGVAGISGAQIDVEISVVIDVAEI